MRLRAVAGIVALALPAQVLSWTAPVHEKIAGLAVHLMPPSLAFQLLKNKDALLEGVRAPDREAAPETHALHADGTAAMRSSRTFDDRGPVFGITEIGFGSGVSATANLWLYVWREAHGDLTNTPHYPPPRRVGIAPDRTRFPQRF